MAETMLKTSKLQFIIREIAFTANTGIYYSLQRRIRISSFTNNLKEVLVSFKNALNEDSETIYKYLCVYANIKGLNIEDIENVYNEFLKDLDGMRNTLHCYENPLMNIVEALNKVMFTINQHIDLLRDVNGIENTKDERFNKTTSFDVYKMTYVNVTWHDEDDKMKDIPDKFDNEYIKQNRKQLNSFKSEIVNMFNKAFGDKSIYAPLKLSEILVK